MERQRRTAVRLIVSAGDAVLLLRYDRDESSGGPFWLPSGGAVESGETHEQAASRELLEETGLSVEVGSRLWDLRVEFPAGDLLIDQTERHFLTELGVKNLKLRNITSEPIAAHRWWTLSELSDTNQVIYPEGLLDSLRANGIGTV